jgi:TolB-like protein/Flp pilus assembly protein TadD
MLAAGSTLGPYKIVAPLGAGGMGEVYRAHDTRLGRDVAIKVLSPHLAARPDVRARFEREARTISQLNYPHICTLYDIGRQEGTDYLVMELLEGETLAHRLEKGPLPVADVLRLGGQIATALDAAHRAGVVHRDLKPGNVMLTKAGAKLMDFGLARAASVAAAPGLLTESPTVSRPLTQEGHIVGTFQYMAPEQLEGREADARSDIWALGCVLYEMVTGKRAFEGASQASLTAAIMDREPQLITELQPVTPPVLERAVHQCLAKDPDERWQSAGDLARELTWIAEARSRAGAPTLVAASSRRFRRLAWAGMLVAAVAVAGVATLWWTRVRRTTQPVAAPVAAHGRAEVAVLPFQNLSAEGPNAYFAGGLHEELLTQLAKVAALKVISRTSVMGYANTTKPLKQIAAELGVGSVVEGSVQVADNRLRVNVQLIDAATDEHLWAERYDRTLDDAFAIQSDVAQRIVAAVGAALTSAEQERLAAAPTANAEAYRLYLQGESYARWPGNPRAAVENAIELYQRALALDPGFALAHAALSLAHGEMQWSAYDNSPRRLASQREEALAALRLDPGLPRAHVALGLWHYWGQRHYRRALREFGIAREGLPNDADLWYRIGAVHRRLGEWAAVDTAIRMATRLDPRDANVLFDLAGYSYILTRRYAEAIRAEERALTMAPDLYESVMARALVYLLWKGERDTMRVALKALPADVGVWATGTPTYWRVYLLLLDRDPRGLLALLRSCPERVLESQDYYLPTALAAGWAHQLAGDEPAARESFRVALAVADSAAWRRDDPRVRVARGLALAGLGRRVEARREAQWLQRSPILREDAVVGAMFGELRACVLAQIGDTEAALDEIEQLLAAPSLVTVHTLRLDPRWDPIREHPRFRALLVKYANPEQWTIR